MFIVGHTLGRSGGLTTFPSFAFEATTFDTYEDAIHIADRNNAAAPTPFWEVYAVMPLTNNANLERE